MLCAQLFFASLSEYIYSHYQNLVHTVFQDLKIDAELQDFRAVKAQTYTDVTLTIAFSRRQQKHEKEIRKSLEEAFSTFNHDYRLTVRFVITTATQKNKFLKKRRNNT